MSIDYSLVAVIGVKLEDLIESRSTKIVTRPKYCESTGKLIRNMEITKNIVTFKSGAQTEYGAFEGLSLYHILEPVGLEDVGHGKSHIVGKVIGKDKSLITHDTPHQVDFEFVIKALRSLRFNPDYLSINLHYVLRAF